MKNLPEVNAGLIAVSRDCFPLELSRNRRKNVAAECRTLGLPVFEVETIIEGEKDIPAALEALAKAHVNSLVIYLGNFGPEGPTTLLAERFDGPVMFVAAAEESGGNLVQGRGDAYCGLLNASYNIGLRRLHLYIPEYPVGTPPAVAEKIAEFIPVARILLGLKHLKIISFGPRPQDFLACNAPVKPLYDLGVEIMENSELDLLDIYNAAEGDKRIPGTAREMAAELGEGNSYPDLLPKLARFEVALLKFAEDNLGSSRYVAFANKCWPAFEKYFGFVPCYVNSRLAARGMPVACEVDIYGALSEYIAACATGLPATLLDINNTVPADMVEADRKAVGDYKSTDLFMGFHCGNTPASCLAGHAMKYQLIMHRLMEPGGEPDITRGTLEGRIRPGEITIFRLQGTSDCRLESYVAQGEILDINPHSFGGIAVFAVPEMGRFYRHVLIERRFPHHTAVAFRHAGGSLFAALRTMGIEHTYFNLPVDTLYPGENPF
jgi:L-fucose isomerase-like protein